ncbi:MAG: 50S ribosomal protein L10 [Acidobacteriota bacterium]
MARTRSEKQETVEQYTEGLASAPHAFLVGFKGITVPEVTELRDKVRETGATYQVVKNTLALRAVKGRSLEELSDQFVGPTAVAYSEDDPVALAKVLTEFRKDVGAIELKGGLLDGQLVSGDQLEDIAKLPGREELIAKLLYLLQSPITRFAQVLAAIPRDFVVVLNQIAETKGEAEG